MISVATVEGKLTDLRKKKRVSKEEEKEEGKKLK